VFVLYREAVYLNVYDLKIPEDPTAVGRWNSYLYWGGLGLYHSGVQVHGKEYAFGGSACSETGVFSVRPRNAPAAVFRESLLVGYTEMPAAQVDSLLLDLAAAYPGNSYNLLQRNCNHFADELSVLLTGNHAPYWINRMAWLGSQLKCVLPEGFDDPFGASNSSSELLRATPVFCIPSIDDAIEESEATQNSSSDDENNTNIEKDPLVTQRPD